VGKFKQRFPSGDQLTFRRKVESGMGEWRSGRRLGDVKSCSKIMMAMKEGWCRQKSEEWGRGSGGGGEQKEVVGEVEGRE